MSTTKKERSKGGGGKKRKKEEVDADGEGAEVASEAANVSASTSVGASAATKASWDWHKCFVLECKRISDRYLKELKDRAILWVHTCASHRTLQDKARRAYKGKDANCHVCYGLNESSESFTAGKFGVAVPSGAPIEEFIMCKTCKYVQERIVTETVDKKVARSEVQDLKRELWGKLVGRLVPTQRSASQAPTLQDLALTEEGDGEAEEESADKDDTAASAHARQSEPTSEVEINKEHSAPVSASAVAMPAPASASAPTHAHTHAPTAHAHATPPVAPHTPVAHAAPSAVASVGASVHHTAVPVPHHHPVTATPTPVTPAAPKALVAHVAPSPSPVVLPHSVPVTPISKTAPSATMHTTGTPVAHTPHVHAHAHAVPATMQRSSTTPVHHLSTQIPVPSPAVPAAADQSVDKEADALKLRDEINIMIETHLRKGSAATRAEEVEDEEMGEEEMEGDEEEEEEEVDEKPRIAGAVTGGAGTSAGAATTGKAKSRK